MVFKLPPRFTRLTCLPNLPRSFPADFAHGMTLPGKVSDPPAVYSSSPSDEEHDAANEANETSDEEDSDESETETEDGSSVADPDYEPSVGTLQTIPVRLILLIATALSCKTKPCPSDISMINLLHGRPVGPYMNSRLIPGGVGGGWCSPPLRHPYMNSRLIL